MRTALLTDSDMYIEMIFQATMRLCLKNTCVMTKI